MHHTILFKNLHSNFVYIPCTTKTTFQASFSILPLYYVYYREEKDDFYNDEQLFGEEKVAGVIDVAQMTSQALQVHLLP